MTFRIIFNLLIHQEASTVLDYRKINKRVTKKILIAKIRRNDSYFVYLDIRCSPLASHPLTIYQLYVSLYVCIVDLKLFYEITEKRKKTLDDLENVIQI